MFVKLVTVVAASVTIAACSAQVAVTDGYLYPNYWGSPPAGVPDSPRLSKNQDMAKAATAPADTNIFGTHIETSYSPGLWLFPPDELDGGSK
jgi:hypothetical protein